MANNNKSDDVYNDASRIRCNVITAILVFLVIVTGLFAYNQYKNVQDQQKKLDKQLAVNKKINKENEKTQKENIKLQKQVGVYDTLTASKSFYDRFFDWSSWAEYLDNLEELRVEYPQIDKGKVVDISGDEIGGSSSPVSSYERQTFIGSKQGEIGEFVTQNKSYHDGTESKAIWYVVSEHKKGKYDIKHMTPYREAH
ncbi:TPA_asm: hypothetical protein GZX72_14280 [Listeria monocytogenes]|nr:hypothetical protein [Listeria monocytogenes]